MTIDNVINLVIPDIKSEISLISIHNRNFSRRDYAVGFGFLTLFLSPRIYNILSQHFNIIQNILNFAILSQIHI